MFNMDDIKDVLPIMNKNKPAINNLKHTTLIVTLLWNCFNVIWPQTHTKALINLLWI